MKMITLILIHFIAGPSIASAEGTAGSRGGGTGIECADRSPVTLEEFQLEQSHILSTIPAQRADVLNWLNVRMKKKESLFLLIKNEWEKNGEYDSWPVFESHAQLASSKAALNELFESATYLKPFAPQLDSTLDNPLIQDDFASIPQDCKKVQLSEFEGDLIYRMPDIHLSEQSKRLLELHESVYRIGMRDYHHQLPLLSRNLIVALNVDDHKNLKKVLKDFQRVPRIDAWRALTNRLFISGGESAKGVKVHDKDFQCPLMLSFSFDGRQHQVVILNIADGKLDISIRHPKETGGGPPSGFLQVFSHVTEGINAPWAPAFFFSTEERAIFPGCQASFDYWGPGFFMLNAYEKSSRASVLSCTYFEWKPSEKIDENTFVKSWNEAFLNRKP